MKKIKCKDIILLIISNVFLISNLFSQVELVPVSHKVYNFLNIMHKKQIIENFNAGNLPISRKEIADFLKVVKSKESLLNNTEEEILRELEIEFEYDINKKIDNTIKILSSFPSKHNLNSIINNEKQKYLYAFVDSNATLFFDGTGFISHRQFKLESMEETFITIAEYGIRLRGSLYNSIGYYLRISSGQQWNGDKYSRIVADKYDPKLHSTTKFLSEKYFETYEGYLRYSTFNDNFSVTVGREKINIGTGYIDKLFLSNNSVPFDFGEIDLKYNKIKYSYFYGDLRGISNNSVLDAKHIISHRIDIGFSKLFKVGIFEAIITSNDQIRFTYLNPVSFLFSADLSAQNDNTSNSIIGLDLEWLPLRNIGLQTSLLIDDFDFKYAWKDVPQSNNNRFGWQIGLFYSDFLGIQNLFSIIEYTHLDPFTYSHKSNMSQYTHWGLPLGHALRPNSDEIALELEYWFNKRLKANLKFQYQRTGEGLVYDDSGNLIKNYGSDINNSDGLYLSKAYFLDGNRIDNFIITSNILFEPIKQIFFSLDYKFFLVNKKYIKKKYFDNLIYLTFYTDL